MTSIRSLVNKYCPVGVKYLYLSEVAEIKRGSTITKSQTSEGDIPVLAGGQQPAYFHNESNREGESIVVAGSGAYAGFVSYWNTPIFVSDAFTVDPRADLLMTKFCYYFLKNLQVELHRMQSGGGVPHVYGKDVGKLQIPVPPIEVQSAIVAILDKFSELEAELVAELEERRREYDFIKNKVFSIDAPTHRLGDVCSSFSGSFIKKTRQDADFLYPVYNGGISPTGYYDEYNTEANSVAISARGASRGFVNWVSVKFWAGNSCHVINTKSSVLLNRYLYHYLKFKELELHQMGKTGSIPALNLEPLLNFDILVPDTDTQKSIIKTLDSLDTLINDISIGLPAEINARRQQYEYYRNKLFTFKKLEVA